MIKPSPISRAPQRPDHQRPPAEPDAARGSDPRADLLLAGRLAEPAPEVVPRRRQAGDPQHQLHVQAARAVQAQAHSVQGGQRPRVQVRLLLISNFCGISLLKNQFRDLLFLFVVDPHRPFPFWVC